MGLTAEKLSIPQMKSKLLQPKPVHSQIIIIHAVSQNQTNKKPKEKKIVGDYVDFEEIE